jgi:CheY-like chemotaxis protein
MLNQAQTDKTVLVVEDDESIRESLQQVLELEGYRVLAAANGQEALDVLQTPTRPLIRPGLILLDLMMPVMNGWDFLQRVREDRNLATIPVIVVTAYSDWAGSLNAEGILRKPVEIDSLLAQVERYYR